MEEVVAAAVIVEVVVLAGVLLSRIIPVIYMTCIAPPTVVAFLPADDFTQQSTAVVTNE